jgi:hypothetical protein
MHWDMKIWLYEINDGHGGRTSLFSCKDYFQLMADALLDKNESVRTAAGMYFTTGTVAAGDRYVYLLDAYIDNGRGDGLHECLRRAYDKSSSDSKERLRILECLIQLRMRQYLWAHPDFGEKHGIKRDKPQRGFRPFWLEHYSVFADQLLAEGDNEFAMNWQEFRKLMGKVHGYDPALYKREETQP